MRKFLVDSMLGKLAKELRMLGYDALYYRGENPRELIRLAYEQERVILTRNAKLKDRSKEGWTILVLQDDPLLQLKELLEQEIIALSEQTLFSRCLLCNSPLDRITREEAEGKVPEFIFYEQEEFYRCPDCHRIYWPGSHPKRMQKRIEEILGMQGPEQGKRMGPQNIPILKS